MLVQYKAPMPLPACPVICRGKGQGGRQGGGRRLLEEFPNSECNDTCIQTVFAAPRDGLDEDLTISAICCQPHSAPRRRLPMDVGGLCLDTAPNEDDLVYTLGVGG